MLAVLLMSYSQKRRLAAAWLSHRHTSQTTRSIKTTINSSLAAKYMLSYGNPQYYHSTHQGCFKDKFVRPFRLAPPGWQRQPEDRPDPCVGDRLRMLSAACRWNTYKVIRGSPRAALWPGATSTEQEGSETTSGTSIGGDGHLQWGLSG